MRSRYSAFALGLADYLQRTQLEPLELPLPRRRKYTGLTIIDARRNEVLFLARIEERGRDHSFAELSKFVKERGEWRYANGVHVGGDRLPLVLTRESFLALAAGE
jgi:SEC-C motif-containing protein